MLKAIVLVCSIMTPGQDCTEATAIDVIRTDPGKSVVSCGLFGQAAIAKSALKPDAKTYIKVVCARDLAAR